MFEAFQGLQKFATIFPHHLAVVSHVHKIQTLEKACRPSRDLRKSHPCWAAGFTALSAPRWTARWSRRDFAIIGPIDLVSLRVMLEKL